MHERGVAKDLVRAAGVVAFEQGARRVHRLRIKVGRGSHIQPESLKAQVEWHARGTICEGVTVDCELGEIPVSGEAADDRVQLVSIDLDG